MKNHPRLEGGASCIAGPGRLIVATPRTSSADGRVVHKARDQCWVGASNAEWQFYVDEAAVKLKALARANTK